MRCIFLVQIKFVFANLFLQMLNMLIVCCISVIRNAICVSDVIESLFNEIFAKYHSVLFAKALERSLFAAEINVPCVKQKGFNCLYQVVDDKMTFTPTVFLFV